MIDFPLPSALRLLRWAVHGTFWVLLVIAVADALHAGRGGVALAGALLGLLGLAGLLGLLYVLGRGSWFGPVWLVLVTVGWAGLAATAPSFGWLAYPLCFAYLRLLPVWAAMYGVAVLTATAAATGVWHAGAVTMPVVAGPLAGALAATLLALVYEAIHAACDREAARDRNDGFGMGGTG
ncbi:hypothetical protein HII36_06320 [Nonomuraea sp. NN258]|uniref:hypothetical protein n=1 Tax=Nonomuraea antri TaxID=2730852 RepID=UPI001568CCAA|nr:hypothetical protein [Nonomuraea antri]NRQ31456.1 hypothetical protein [Nonomuraea antri]